MLVDCFEIGRTAWPTLAVDGAAFAAFVDATPASPEERRRHARDLYLAFACASGDVHAFALLDAQYIAPLAAQIARVTQAHEVPDVLQLVRVRFLTGDTPAIARYDGTAALATWLRVAAVRLAISNFRKQPRASLLDDDEAALEQMATEPSPELELLQRTYGDAFRAAFRAAWAALEARERTLLRQQILDRVGIDRLALLHGVHRATAARWVAQARAQLIAAVRTRLAARLGVAPGQLDSILEVLQDQFEISVRLFATPTPD